MALDITPMTTATLKEAVAFFRRHDPALAKWAQRVGPVGLRRQKPAFRALYRSVLSQQVSSAAARTILSRFEGAFAKRRPTPSLVLALAEEEFRACGVSRQKAGYLRGLAQAFASGDVNPRRYASMSDDDVIAELTRVRGIGAWTAEMFLIFCLGRPDVFSAGDLGLRAGVMRVARRSSITPDAAKRHAERWQPYRSVACLYLWKIAHFREENEVVEKRESPCPSFPPGACPRET